MKRPTTIISKILCAILISICFSCNQPKKEKEPEIKEPTKVKAPTNIISLNEADAIYNNYTKHRVQIIEDYENQERPSEEKFEASRFVDFDYKTLKQYIAYLDQEAAAGGVDKITKLRLYFANYPNEEKFPNGKPVVHKKQNSIFMVPTLDQEGINYGFYIGDDGKAELIKNWKENNSDGLSFQLDKKNKAYAGFVPNFKLNSNLQGSKSLAFNFGQGGPPPKTDF
ncbi:hypothetical protein [Maribacter ulvicola]|uniref:Uncharacterized protein n=1 Tax=Maribacter ulvicola TaxID=228959 RepID=A0A1N6S0M0_9FLAO|nr:hypothetical protein [Maribacter ulvicola]SIQ34605.1 hypothetical protein SAMN05421797_1011469 [Maribacter ulvicola]